MNIVKRPEIGTEQKKTKLRDIFEKIKALPDGSALELTQGELTSGDQVQLYRFAKKEHKNLHITTKEGKQFLWLS
jgi:hypothetical protein